MRKIQLVLPVAFVLLSLSVPAAAQFKDLKINLPFAFQVGQDKLPAGTYTFGQETRNDRMQISGGKQRLMINTSVLPPEELSVKPHTTLIFHRAGDKYFLHQLWTRSIGYQMPLSDAEKEAAASRRI